MNRRRGRVRSIWRIIRGVRDDKDLADRLRSWGVRSSVFDSNVHLVGSIDRF